MAVSTLNEAWLDAVAGPKYNVAARHFTAVLCIAAGAIPVPGMGMHCAK